MRDYPAAHSMDTTWFAVDEEGNVGLFESGEDGAVPIDAASAGGAADPSFDLFPLQAALVARTLVNPSADEEVVEGATPLPRNKSRVVLVIEPVAGDEKVVDYRTAQRSDVESMLEVPVTVLREASPRIVATNEPIAPALITMLAKHRDVRTLLDESDLGDVFFEDAALLDALDGLGLAPCAGALVKTQKKLPMVNSKSYGCS